MIYYFIENLTEIDPNSEIKILDNLILKVVPVELQDSLKTLIKRYNPQSFFSEAQNEFVKSYHEFEFKAQLPSGGISNSLRKKSDFRYCVLEESNSNRFNLIYPRAFALAEKDFFIPFSFSNNDLGLVMKTSFSELCTFICYNDKNVIIPFRGLEPPNDFTELDKNEVIKYINLLNDFEEIKEGYPYIYKALQDYFLIREISDFSVFKVVSYIACLELLLVDNNQERLKSINSQLQSKLNLLNNQFEKPIIISDYIKGPDTLTLGKVIETIYNYRSSIAHGDFLDFKKKLQILESVSEKQILKFIKTVLKKVLIYSLSNPNLMRDLKKC